MKSPLLIACLLTAPYTLLAQSNRAKLDSLETLIFANSTGLKKLDEKYGFRDLKFGTPLALVKGAVAVGPVASNGERKYRRPSESKVIGSYKVADIVYTFYKGKLAFVHIVTKGITNSSGLMSMFDSLYDPGSVSNESPDIYSWSGQKVAMICMRDPATGDATFDMFSLSLMSAAEKSKEAVNEKAASEL